MVAKLVDKGYVILADAVEHIKQVLLGGGAIDNVARKHDKVGAFLREHIFKNL